MARTAVTSPGNASPVLPASPGITRPAAARIADVARIVLVFWSLAVTAFCGPLLCMAYALARQGAPTAGVLQFALLFFLGFSAVAFGALAIGVMLALWIDF